MKNKKRRKELFPLYLLWGTQTFSALGSAITSYALVIWSYAQTGQALSTALLMVCSYAPYVLMSIFAGALSDWWDKRRTMIAVSYTHLYPWPDSGCTAGCRHPEFSGNRQW